MKKGIPLGLKMIAGVDWIVGLYSSLMFVFLIHQLFPSARNKFERPEIIASYIALVILLGSIPLICFMAGWGTFKLKKFIASTNIILAGNVMVAVFIGFLAFLFWKLAEFSKPHTIAQGVYVHSYSLFIKLSLICLVLACYVIWVFFYLTRSKLKENLKH
ncbi:MAG: hypothetical protein M0R20_00335 [Candidatus Omnitrophica bacterium]|jgi:uncharacterized membrane protein YozB (DUF420 family)|nr:hypothetical protein [Candidatus Omnitrophota bacterium]